MAKQDKIETISINGKDYVLADSVTPVDLSDRVIVRCRNAGVHVGTLVKRNELDTVLENANRIYRWRGAHDLSVVALEGVNRKEYTRISPMLPSITLTTGDTCEIIHVAEGVDLTEVHNVN